MAPGFLRPPGAAAGPGATIQRHGGPGGTIQMNKDKVINALNTAKRLAWRVGDTAEFQQEIATYAAQVRREAEEAVRLKQEFLEKELNNRHKVAWEDLKTGLAVAVKKNDPMIANAVLAISGSFHIPPFQGTKDSRWKEVSTKPATAVRLLQEVGRTPINVFTGNAGINKGSGSDFDWHQIRDPLGLKTVSVDPDDGSATPWSFAVSDIGFDKFISGKKKFSDDELLGLANGGWNHYDRLASQAKAHGDRDAKRFFRGRRRQWEENLKNWDVVFN